MTCDATMTVVEEGDSGAVCSAVSAARVAGGVGAESTRDGADPAHRTIPRSEKVAAAVGEGAVRDLCTRRPSRSSTLAGGIPSPAQTVSAGEQPEAVVQAGDELVETENRYPQRDQSQRQRDAVEPPTDFHDRGCGHWGEMVGLGFVVGCARGVERTTRQ